MSRIHHHREAHRSDRIGWLRAAVMGANDGIISVSCIILGVINAGTSRSNVLLSGAAGLVAGAMSMAAGEYVSVSSQADTERADAARELAELESDPIGETEELAQIYRKRGLSSSLAQQVARELMSENALETHLRDELGITNSTSARPVQAALASAASFTTGAILPLAIAFLTIERHPIFFISAASLASLAFLGGIAARTGGASIWKGAVRVVFWGALAMMVTALIGSALGRHSP